MRSLAALARQRERLHLERDRDIEAEAVCLGKFPDGLDEAVNRRQQPLIAHVLAGGSGKGVLNQRRLAMRDGVADDGVAVERLTARRLL